MEFNMVTAGSLNLSHLDKSSRSRQQAEWDDGMDLDQILCPLSPGHQRGGKRTTDLKIVLQNTKLDDFIWFDYAGECVIQDRVLQLFRENSLSGFEVRPVKARFERSNAAPPTLWEVVLTGWAGLAKPESGIELDRTKFCAACGHLRYTGLQNEGELINMSIWDGSDFFMVWPMPRYFFVTDRVVNTIRNHHLTGVHIVPVSELKKTDGFSPGRLHYYMPDDRARRLGEPLGIY